MKHSSFALIQHRKNPDKFLVVKKRKSGKWTLPGGQLEAGIDKNHRETVIRETEDEIGAKVSRASKIDEYKRQCGGIVYVYKVKLKSDRKVRIADDEHTEYAWVKLASFNETMSTTLKYAKRRLHDIIHGKSKKAAA